MHIHRLLDQRVTVLTASRRLAHALRADYARYATGSGRLAWPTPRILPWLSWLRQQWLEVRARSSEAMPARLLTPAQAAVLWSDIVASSEAGSRLLNPSSAARLAARSWQRMHDYLISPQGIARAAGAEAQALDVWFVEFTARCRKLRAIDEARLAAWAHEAELVPEQEIALAGFDVVPPALGRLLGRWRECAKVHEIAPAPEAAAVEVVRARDPQEEIERAARFARAQLEAGRSSVGILLADLHSRRAEIERVFEDVFAPGERVTGAQAAALPVTIAAPEPLIDYPIVDAALLIIGLAAADCSSTHAGRLLRSPFLAGGESERDARALADFRLRDEQRDRWDWFELERWAGVTGCTQLQVAARGVVQRLRADSDPVVPSRWVERWHTWLRAAGWPGERPLDSVEHQTVAKLHAALADFGTLDAVTRPLSTAAALAMLRNLLRDTPFERQTEAAAVTVIDPATVAGMTFEVLWAAGLDATRLPAAPAPDPLLPLDLQREAGIPEASAEGMLKLSQGRLRRFTSSAAQVVLSWPQQDGEAQLQPSPMLAAWPERRDGLLLAGTRAFRQSLFAHRPELIAVRDDTAPALDAAAARGGASILELQSRCPFRAQAELRLRAAPLPRVSLGVEPLDRGIILHRVLEELWGTLQDQARLLATPEQELAERLRVLTERHAMRALQPAVRYRARLAALEVDGLVAQILRLLHIEKQRTPFRLRFAEAADTFTIGGLEVTLRPDRIDELADGGRVIIDYKLGASHQPRQWLDAWPGRPRHPQLPLYGLAHERSLAALAFVVVAPGAVEYRGWSNGARIGAGVASYPAGMRSRPMDPPDWQALLGEWRASLTRLAEQFVAGRAEVDPLPQECMRCHLSTLCRKHELSSAAAGNGEQSGNEAAS